MVKVNILYLNEKIYESECTLSIRIVYGFHLKYNIIYKDYNFSNHGVSNNYNNLDLIYNALFWQTLYLSFLAYSLNTKLKIKNRNRYQILK